MVAQAIEAAGGLTEQEVQELVFASRTTANVKAFLREHEHDYHQSPENDALMNRFLVENKLVPSVENLELAMETLGDMLVSPEITRYQQQPSLPPLPRPRSAQPERKPVQTGLPDSRTPAAPPDQIAELMKVVQDPSVSRDVAEDALRRAMRIKAERANRPYGSF